MKTTLWLVPIAAGLAACVPYSDPYGGQGYPGGPNPYPGPPPPPPPGDYQPYSDDYGQQGGLYRATGTEPFWSLEIGQDLVFTDQGTGRTVTERAPRPTQTSNGERYRTQRMDVTITRIRCSDGMSDRTYPETVQVYVDGQLYRGCGAPAAFYSQVDEQGNYSGPGQNPYPQGDPYPPADPYPPQGANPPYPPQGANPPMSPQGPAPSLNNTRWRVAMVNGQRTPQQGDYSIQFEGGKMTARFGCNTLSAGYVQNGGQLDPGAFLATRMACSNMQFENMGSDVLSQDMTVTMLDARHIVLENARGSIALERR